MKLSKKTLNSFMMVLGLLLAFSGCKTKQSNTSSQTTIESTSQITTGETKKDKVFVATSKKDDFTSYSAKENNKKNNINYVYPLFNQKVKDSEKLNKIIAKHVEDELNENYVWNDEFTDGNEANPLDDKSFMGALKTTPEKNKTGDYTNIMVNVDYEITFYNSNFVSIIFSGTTNNKRSPYPKSYFKALTLDLKKCKEIKIADLYNINEDFIKIVKKEYDKQMREYLANNKDIDIEENMKFDHLSVFSDNEDTKGQMEYLKDTEGFLAENRLGIKIELPHVAGDNLKIYIDYEKLQSFEKQKVLTTNQ